MAADGTLLQGEVNEKPEANSMDVEKMLGGFLGALLKEQSASDAAATAASPAASKARVQE